MIDFLILSLFSSSCKHHISNIITCKQHVLTVKPALKELCHAIWYIFKKLNGVFASIESKKSNSLVLLLKTINITTLKLFLVVCCCGRQGWKWIET